jgi:hypothetical protein
MLPVNANISHYFPQLHRHTILLRMTETTTISSSFLLLLLSSTVSGDVLLTEDILAEQEDVHRLREDARTFIYFNSSSTATALTLLGALILLGVIFYLVYVGGLFAPTQANSSSYNYAYNKNDYYGGAGSQHQYRAARYIYVESRGCSASVLIKSGYTKSNYIL